MVKHELCMTALLHYLGSAAPDATPILPFHRPFNCRRPDCYLKGLSGGAVATPV